MMLLNTRLKNIVLPVLIMLCTYSAMAQNGTLIKIATKDNLLLLGVDGQKLKQYYYGKNIGISNTGAFKGSPDAYPTFGVNVEFSALRVTHADGNATTELVYRSVDTLKVDDNSTITTIKLRDSFYALNVSICYKTYTRENIIEQWTEVDNQEKGAVTLFDAASANLAFKNDHYYATTYSGDWTNEYNLTEEELQPGNRVVESRLGVRTSQHTSPEFMLALNQKLDEDKGDVIGGALAWPGNFQFVFNVNDKKDLQVSAGINPYASAYLLDAGKKLKLPSLLYTFSSNGAGEITRRFHRWARQYGIADGKGKRDVLFNNWEATTFDFNEDKLSSIIKEAGAMGYELFLLDDGWFGNKHPRNTDQAGLGDWEVNTAKLPHGLDFLAKQCQANNLKFGLWVEPEMVNPQSDLYEKHPDWVLTAPNRGLDLQRNQLILDLTNPRVQDYINTVLEKLVTDNKGISYLKWDCNRYLSNAGSFYLAKNKQANLYVDYSNALLGIMQKFKAKFPNVAMMLCASGGGRMDYGSMRYFNEYWPSDNTNPVDRVRIQWGLTYFFPSVGMAAHVTSQSAPLKFRFDVAMAGKLGMDMLPSHLSADEKAFSQKAIETYKGIRDVVLQGDLYRLLSPYNSDRVSQMYVSENQQRAVVFNYLMKRNPYGNHQIVYLKGLNPNTKYKITELNKTNFTRLQDYDGQTFTGAELMAQGLKFSMWGELESDVILLESVL
jgi:alpha-galactosidase